MFTFVWMVVAICKCVVGTDTYVIQTCMVARLERANLELAPINIKIPLVLQVCGWCGGWIGGAWRVPLLIAWWPRRDGHEL